VKWLGIADLNILLPEMVKRFFGRTAPMNFRFREETARPVSQILLCLAIGSGAVIVGCSSEVGSSPSSKNEIREFVAKDQPSQFTGKGAMPAKGTPAPQSIKKKLFSSKTGSPNDQP
jgi:hypothetical protein